MQTVSLISLGCPRNLVDSEVMLGLLLKAGYVVKEPDECPDILIINTCAFIQSAKEESIDAILEACDLKKKGHIKFLTVAGCLSQYYKNKLPKELKEVDLFLGTGDFADISNKIDQLFRRGGLNLPYEIVGTPLYLYNEKSSRQILTPSHYAYIKISEGCSNFCSYCVISRLRGVLRSRTIESVLNEIKILSRNSRLKEVNLIGQDTTVYGQDIYGRPNLAALLKKTASLKTSVEWIRVFYTHPAHYTDELIDCIRNEEKICKYLDIPIQHINDRILEKMNRPTKKRDIITLIEKIRRRIPNIAIRTALIIGFPGETECEFKELLGFVRDIKFERLGVFIYSREEDTKAGRLKCQIPEKEKRARFDEVMKLQQRIAEGINKNYLGKVVKVLIDEKLPPQPGRFARGLQQHNRPGCGGWCIGRTEHDAPEIDGSVYVTGKGLKVGEFYDVKITDTLEYDLVGETTTTTPVVVQHHNRGGCGGWLYDASR